MSVVTKIYAKQQNEVIFFDLIIFCSRYSDTALRNIKKCILYNTFNNALLLCHHKFS